MFKYLFTAKYEDGHEVVQPADDRYSMHDDAAEHNPSAFRDVLDYMKVSPLKSFILRGTTPPEIFAVDLRSGEFFMNGTLFMLDQPLEELTDRKVIYFRTMRMDMQTGKKYIYAYNFGYEGKDADGKVIKKVITVR